MVFDWLVVTDRLFDSYGGFACVFLKLIAKLALKRFRWRMILNDSVTKSLDLICLAMFHTRLLRIRCHLLCNVFSDYTEKLSSVRESGVQLSKESVRGTS